MSNESHRIHLRRPWQCQVSGGRALWSRRFGRPARLGPGERVWLVFEGFPGNALAKLNGQAIALDSLDVTDLLQVRNELALETPDPAVAISGIDTPPGEVVLEIRISPHW